MIVNNKELYHSDVYLGKDYSNGIMHFKYIKRERLPGGGYKYYYKPDERVGQLLNKRNASWNKLTSLWVAKNDEKSNIKKYNKDTEMYKRDINDRLRRINSLKKYQIFKKREENKNLKNDLSNYSSNKEKIKKAENNISSYKKQYKDEVKRYGKADREYEKLRKKEDIRADFGVEIARALTKGSQINNNTKKAINKGKKKVNDLFKNTKKNFNKAKKNIDKTKKNIAKTINNNKNEVIDNYRYRDAIRNNKKTYTDAKGKIHLTEATKLNRNAEKDMFKNRDKYIELERQERELNRRKNNKKNKRK